VRALLAMPILLLLLALLWPSSAVTAEPPASHGQALAYACAACHGPDGRSQGAIPAIHNLPSEDLMAALKAFRANARPSTVMNRIAKGLDDADISALAAYFASREKP
jgi:sulfide dehydrogenase cytochrome subunit